MLNQNNRIKIIEKISIVHWTKCDGIVRNLKNNKKNSKILRKICIGDEMRKVDARANMFFAQEGQHNRM